jgi:hypothetical protein
MRLTAGLIRLYPRTWRERYGEEMAAVLEVRTPRNADRADLLRGALDAWIHPASPSLVPAAAALIGGGAWTLGAVAIVTQPVPPDWPGYLLDILWLALLAVGLLLVATIGCALRFGDTGGNAARIAIVASVVGYIAWIAALAGIATGHADGPILAAAQTLAMGGTLMVGLLLLRSGDEPLGALVVAAPVAMLIPWTGTWLAFGAAWTVIGMVLIAERARPSGERQRPA